MRRMKGGIAFFDSGIGGLTVLDECRKWLPDTIFYYYGDNKHAPYGNLPPKKIKKYLFRAFKRFQRLQVWAAVVACNTATAVCVEELREKFAFPIIGTEPAVLPAMRKGGEVFVLSTRATYESSRFRALCKNVELLFPSTQLKCFPCDGLAREIERHICEGDFDYTSLLPRGSPDAVVLGCTHYTYIARQIEKFYQCPVYDGNQGIACRLTSVLREKFASNVYSQPLDDHFQPFFAKKHPGGAKNRDKVGRMKLSKKSHKPIFLTRFSEKENPVEVMKKERTVFLGGHREHNKSIYEHMFV